MRFDRGTCGIYSPVIAINSGRRHAAPGGRTPTESPAGACSRPCRRCDKNKSKSKTGIIATLGITRAPRDRRLDCATCRDLENHRHSWIELAPTRELLRYGCVVCYARKTVKHPRPNRQLPPPPDYSDPDFWDPTDALIEGFRRLPKRPPFAPAVREGERAPRDPRGRRLN